MKQAKTNRLGLILIVILVALLFRPVIHYLCVPSQAHSSWVKPLATAGSGLRSHAELEPRGLNATQTDTDSDFDLILKANDQKRELYAAFKSGTGKHGLFRQYSTVEGRPIFSWVLVDEGKITFIHDHSRDGGAWPWEVDTYHPKLFRLGFLQDNEFVEGEPAQTNSPVIVFEMDVGKYSPARFY